MNEKELKDLIQHTFLLSEEAKKSLLSISLEGEIGEEIRRFFEKYGATESMIIEDIWPTLLLSRKYLQAELEEIESINLKKESEQNLSFITA